jgi:hypothetical protein
MSKAQKKVDGEARLLATATKESKGILVARLKESSMDAAAEGIDLIDGTAWAAMVRAQDKAEALHAHYQEAEKTGEVLVRCLVCDGESPAANDECAFCGDRGEEEEEDAESEAGGASSPAPVRDIPVPSALVGASSPGAPKADKPKPTTALAVVDGGKAAPMATTNVGKGPLANLKERDLDKAVREVEQYKGAAGAAFWDLGNAVRDIYERSLWKLRSAEGKPQLYRSFEAFCNAELGMNPQSALNSMDTCKRYTRAMAEKYGRSKMTFLVRADEMSEPVLRRAMEGGASKRELATKAKELKAGKPVVERSGKVRKAPEKTRPASGDKITVAALLDKTHLVKAWKRPAGKLSQLANTRDLERAKKVNDEPVGRFELANGVVQYITLKPNAAGELQFAIKFAREEAATEAKAAE